MDKITQLSHYDLDGIVCAIIVKKYLPKTNISNYQCGYNKLNQIIDKMIEENKILQQSPPLFVTDISLTQDQLELLSKNFSKVFVIDHHEQTEKLSPLPNVKIIYDGKFCGAHIVYEFFKKVYSDNPISLSENFRKLVYLANDYDMWLHEDPNSYMLNELFWEMNWNKFFKTFSDGFDKIPEKEVKRIKEKIKIKYNELESMKIYKIPDSKNPDAVFCIIDKYNSIKNDITLFWKKKYKYFFIYDKDIKALHLRTGDGAEINYNDILHSLFDDTKPDYIENFGGHAYAASVTFKEFTDSNQVMETVEKIYNNI